MRVLLTGVTGFIGSHVARLLVSEGHRVFAVVRAPRERWRVQDVEVDLDMISGALDHVEARRRFIGNVQARVLRTSFVYTLF